jgi:hypothetical protein
MKYILLILALLLLAIPAGAQYSTSFSATENPISQGGVWRNGAAQGTNWGNERTIPGQAFGTVLSPGCGDSDPTACNDSTAVLTGTWIQNQTVTAVVHTVNQNPSLFEEAEIRLNTTITAGNITGYEFNFAMDPNTGSQYCQIVRWNGPLGSFNVLDSGTGPGVNNGDTLSATNVNGVLKSFINGVLCATATDSTYTAGSPGMGFFDAEGTTASLQDFGFTSFSATGGTVSGGSVSISPTSLSFGSVTDGTTSSGKNATVSNGSASTINFTGGTGGASFSGTNASDFSETNNCSTTLKSSGTCVYTVEFRPTASAGTNETATMTVAFTGAGGSPLAVSLSGISGDEKPTPPTDLKAVMTQ